MSRSGIISEASTRGPSIDLSYSEIDSSQLEMDIDSANASSEVHPDTTNSKPKDQETRKEAAIERDPIYFCENVVLMAEDRVFSVPKGGLLNNGTYFHSLFGPQILKDTDLRIPAAGSSEQHPIVLKGISKVDFHNLLRVIYPFQGIDFPSGDEHWLGILDLATKWGFQEARETALLHLDHIFTSNSPCHDPIHALYLCQKYNIQKYMKQQFEALIISITPLDHATMLARGIDTETVLLLTHLRDKWTCGMLWGDKGSGNGVSSIFPRRLSAKKIIEDHFAGPGPKTMSQEETDMDAHWKQDEAKRLDNEVRLMEEAEKDECAAQGHVEGSTQEDEMPENQAVSEESEAHGGEGSSDYTCSDSSEIDVDPPADAAARTEKLILLHAEKTRTNLLIEELKTNGVSEADSRMQELTVIAEENNRKLCKYWGKATGLLSSHSPEDIANKYSNVDLAGHHELGSRQILEQAIQNLLHPHTRSLFLSIKMGRGEYSTNVRIRETTLRVIMGR
ncbi:hypothetical protein BJ165DRAFT_1457155 [Panaeolus papilionaceus]|nr:hypothetical protein BJ165DRAFT_1457155 [Panaeolus papilionaceus]